MAIDKDYLEEIDDKFASSSPSHFDSKKNGKAMSADKKTGKSMRKKERHGKPIYDPHYKKADDRLKDVNALKEKMIAFYNNHDILKGDRYLSFLVEIQKDTPELLAKSLCDACNQISASAQPEKLLELACSYNPNDSVALNSYGKALAENGDVDKACELFERSLAIEPNDTIALNSYAKALAESGDVDKASELFECCLAIEPNNPIALNSYAKALAENGDVDKACVLFERSLAIEPNNTIALNSYGKALAENGKFDNACKLFEHALTLEPNNPITIKSYGKALAENGKFDKACELFELALAMEPNDTIALNSYGKALAENGKFDKACELFELALAMEPNDTIALNSYGKALAENGDVDKACELFERSLAIDPNDNIALYLYGRLLFNLDSYPNALHYLKRVQRLEMSAKARVVICFLLGQLSYLSDNKKQAETYFAEAIEFSKENDYTRIKAAQHILAADPHSEKAFEILQEIDVDHRSYDKAEKMLAFHLPFSAYYKKFQGETRYDLQMLNRGIYHKIQNEISILKSIAQRTSLQDAESDIHHEVISRLEEIIDVIATNRVQEQHSLETIASNDLKSIEAIISTTVHRIVDYVNNELAIIKSYTRRMLRKESSNSRLHSKLGQLLEQIERSETALNDLKAVNEGVKLNSECFNVSELFTQWSHQQLLENAKLTVKVFNTDSVFSGDYQKLRSCINEIIENSLKHNPNIPLTITITSKDSNYLPFQLNAPIKKGQRFLAIILSDNGKGIPADKKEWIFFPLNSTYPESSGLGLFLVKKTIEAMNGYIVENGTKGAKFSIYLPYQDSSNE